MTSTRCARDRLATLTPAFVVCALLVACTSTPVQNGGRVLQSGPADAPLYETVLESPGTCEMFVNNFGSTARASSRCVAKTSGLSYGYDMSMEGWGRVRVTANTQAGCERSRINALGKDNMKVLTKCEKNKGDDRK